MYKNNEEEIFVEVRDFFRYHFVSRYLWHPNTSNFKFSIKVILTKTT